jgi:hypothetical protein
MSEFREASGATTEFTRELAGCQETTLIRGIKDFSIERLGRAPGMRSVVDLF